MIPSDPETPPNGLSAAREARPLDEGVPISTPEIETASSGGGDPVAATPSPAPEPFWGYADLVFFIALCFPCLLIAIGVVTKLTNFPPFNKPFQQVLLLQLIWYVLIFAALYGLFRIRYGRPFWRSLGWKALPLGAAVFSFLGGPVLAAVLGYLGFVLRTPEIPLPFQQLISDRTTVLLTGLFVVILGPVCEELAFRGFMMPLFMRTFGAIIGVLFTGCLFGFAHGFEYQWSWRHIVLISTAGCIFGWARYRTGSTISAAFMHATFNLTQFAAFLAQSRTQV